MSQPLETMYLDDVNSALVILDQQLLPTEVKYVPLTTLEQVYHAIHTLQVRGAPAIGVSAAMGLYIHMKDYAQKNAPTSSAFMAEMERAGAYLASSRPTAVNLQWALNELTHAIEINKNRPFLDLVEILRQTAERIMADDMENNRLIGKHGAALLKPGMGILTHCNAGALATAGYGTALAPIYYADENGMDVRVYVDETRPILQGARLTAFELNAAGIDTTLICDNMAATVMAKGWVDAVFVGCDRVAANGDTANKIGTHGVAVLAKHFGIPFYVCAPFSTIDKATATGADILIEQRDPKEVTHMWYTSRVAPDGINVFNPAFDVTPAALIEAFITEKGILKPPFDTKH
ncbi:MAG: S-methyl-5-thioribose-1-phosphate isomerase [Defluviitaleaceae bacterium]|nr:S-methyl-5-thioribose-1-phosphate isomerase [Defluviitaleaceae bacterium]MCL2274139.1 S-methyl-5-thioribose-1-phosphate isomerase [Defluviitaleaceae bacterium]